MKKLLRISALLTVLLVTTNVTKATAPAAFTENKGQVSDQFHRSRSEILYNAPSEGYTAFFKQSGYEVQLFNFIADEDAMSADLAHKKRTKGKFEFYRIDIDWLNSSKASVVRGENVTEEVENFYLAACPQGALNVHSYKKIEYQQLYAGIDLKWYYKNGQLKYDYHVAAGADYRSIQLQVNGATSLSLDKEGNLLIETPMGTLTEQAPFVLQEGRVLYSKWQIKGKVISFYIEGIDASKEFVIDPLLRLWGTFFGGNAAEELGRIYADGNGNVYVACSTLSSTSSNIATVGSHQSTYGGNVSAPGYPGDAVLVKMNASGQRLWSTYYGGSGYEYGNDVKSDNLGNIYLVGGTTSSNTGVIATSDGLQQTLSATNGSLSGDGFIAKFTTAGVRIYGTYYGDSNDDWCTGVDIDRSNNIYVSGTVWSGPGVVPTLSTTGCHQPIHSSGAYNGDAFVTKFSSGGARIWSTYYGGTGWENGTDIVVDTLNRVYLLGSTTSTNVGVISSSNGYQVAYGGTGSSNLGDAFIAFFDAAGQRQWATYYGSTLDEIFYAGDVDPNNNLVAFGTTMSNITNSLSTPNAFQPNYGGGNSDGMMVRFAASGARRYASYYGGSANEETNAGCVSKSGAIYMTGCSLAGSTSSLVTCGAYQNIHGGGFRDAYIARFDSTGNRKWGSFFGGPADDYQWFTVSADATDNLYLAGMTTAASSSAVVLTSGAFQATYGGGSADLFFEKFDPCFATAPNFTTNYNACVGQKAVLQGNGNNCSLTWYANASLSTLLGVGSTFTTGVLSGDTTFYVTDKSCGITSAAAVIQLTSAVSPTVTISSSNNLICIGTSATLSPNGAVSYTWSGNGGNGAIVVSPTITTTYTVRGSAANGCSASAMQVLTVDLCAGIKANVAQQVISLYPNPAQHRIEVTSPVAVTVRIYSATGNFVLSRAVAEGTESIDISFLSNGIYIAELESAQGKQVLKLIKTE